MDVGAGMPVPAQITDVLTLPAGFVAVNAFSVPDEDGNPASTASGTVQGVTFAQVQTEMQEAIDRGDWTDLTSATDDGMATWTATGGGQELDVVLVDQPDGPDLTVSVAEVR